MWLIYDGCETSDFVNCRFKEEGDCLVHRPRLSVTPKRVKPIEKEMATEDLGTW